VFHWSCNNVSGGTVVVVMISEFVQDNIFAVNVWKNKQLLFHSSFNHSSLELVKEVQIQPHSHKKCQLSARQSGL
jgi:hypothetical protein